MKRLFIIICAVCLIVTVSCKKDDKEIKITNGTDISLFSEETHQIECESQGTVTYTGSDEFIASVSQKGLVTANHVGRNVINLNDGKYTADVNITVNPKYNTYPEPAIDFGDSENKVREELGEPYMYQDGYMVYMGYSAKAPMLMVEIENGKVESYSVVVDDDYSIQVTKYLVERYQPIYYNDAMVMYMNAMEIDKATKIVGESLENSDFIIVIYIPNDTKEYDFRSLSDELNNKFKLFLKKIQLFS